MACVRPTVRGVAMNPIDHPHGGVVKEKHQVVDILFLHGEHLLRATKQGLIKEQII